MTIRRTSKGTKKGAASSGYNRKGGRKDPKQAMSKRER